VRLRLCLLGWLICKRVRSLGKVTDLNVAVQSAETRAKDALDAAESSKLSASSLVRECDRLTALLRERDGSDAVRHLHEWQVPPHLALQNGVWGAHPHPAWPGPPPLMAPQPIPIPLHGNHEPQFMPAPVAFGDFSQFLAPPGFQIATPVPLSQAPAAETAPPPVDEHALVSIFSRAAPAVPEIAITPDELLSRVEERFLRPHSWVPHYSTRYGSMHDFIQAHADAFAMTSDGRVFRRPPQVPLQMMVTPLPPPVQGGIVAISQDGSKAIATAPDAADEAVAAATEPRRGQQNTRGRGQASARGRKTSSGRGGGRAVLF